MLNVAAEKELTITQKSGKAFGEDGWQLLQDVCRQRFKLGVKHSKCDYEGRDET